MAEPNLLDKSSLLERLPGLREVHIFDELESTSDLGKELASGDQLIPAIIYARSQTKGRGRSGKTWVSNRNSLTFSFVLESDFNENQSSASDPESESIGFSIARFSIDWGLAVAQGLNDLSGISNPFSVKWPNDVMAMQKKVAGILIESVAGFPGRQVVGIGINVGGSESIRADVDSVQFQAATVEEVLGQRISHIEILESVWNQFNSIQRLSQTEWESSYGQLDFLSNKRVSIQRGQSILTGRYSGIGTRGELLLNTEQGVLKIVSGSVVQIDD